MPNSLFPVAIAICTLLYGFYTFDRLVQLQYARHRCDWFSDGRPAGFFWRPPEVSWMQGQIAKERLSLKWLFVTPEWARGCEDAGHLLHHMRVAVGAWNVIVIAAVFSAGLV